MSISNDRIQHIYILYIVSINAQKKLSTPNAIVKELLKSLSEQNTVTLPNRAKTKCGAALYTARKQNASEEIT